MMCPARADSQRNTRKVTTATREITAPCPAQPRPGSLSSQFLRRILHVQNLSNFNVKKKKRIVGYRSYVVRIICRKGTDRFGQSVLRMDSGVGRRGDTMPLIADVSQVRLPPQPLPPP